MEPVHQAAAVRITVLLPSAAIGRKTLCRRLSPLLIGPACLTGRRRAAPCAWKKKKEKKRKKNSSRSEYQSERSSGDRKRKRKPRSGRTERQDRIETITPAGLDLTRGRDGTVCRPNFDAALLVTVGITLDTW